MTYDSGHSPKAPQPGACSLKLGTQSSLHSLQAAQQGDCPLQAAGLVQAAGLDSPSSRQLGRCLSLPGGSAGLGLFWGTQLV